MRGPGAADDGLRAALDPLHRSWQAGGDHRPAAVLVPIVAAAAGDELLLIKRRHDLRHHAGQIAFPGGGRDGGEDPVACALRELDEELGIAAAEVDVLGGLPCHMSGAGYLVHPTVGRIAEGARLRPQASEVEAVLRVPLAALGRADAWSWQTMQGGGRTWRSRCFPVGGGEVLWGLTARVVLDLLQRLG